MFDFSNLEKVFNEYFNQKDIYVTLKITKVQAKTGISMPIEITQRIIGKDEKSTFKKISEIINIPKNTKNDTVFELKQKGNQCKNGEKGNLYIRISIFGNI